MEVINSFFSNIKDKLTNPFFGTLILVLIFHHWELIYAMFNFDISFTIDEKLEFLQNYISENISLKSVVIDFGRAALFMTLGFIIVIGTRAIVMFMEHNLMPLITRKIVSKNVVEKKVYDEVVKEREEYFDQYEEQRKNVRNFSKTIDTQLNQIKEKDKNLGEQSQTITKTLKEKDKLAQDLSSAKDKNNKLATILKRKENSYDELDKKLNNINFKLIGYESLFFEEENVRYYNTPDKFPPEVINKVNQLKREKKWGNFEALGRYLRKGGGLSVEIVNQMTEEGLIIEKEGFEDWTALGRIINKYYEVFKNI